MTIRDYEPNDRAMVANNWLRSFRESPYAKHMRNDVYYGGHSPLVNALIDACQIRVASIYVPSHDLPSGPESRVDIGWVCFQPGVLHYAYVKELYRRSGVSSALLESAGVPNWEDPVYTHRRPPFSGFLVSKWGLDYDPYSAFSMLPEAA